MLTHLERMKTLERGRDLPGDAATAWMKAASGSSSNEDESRSLAHKCFSTALWVAFWGFIAASWSSMPVAIAIAASTGGIGVTAMICGTILAFRNCAPPQRTSTAKPFVHGDAFDFASRNG
jgi:hypothetical protein